MSSKIYNKEPVLFLEGCIHKKSDSDLDMKT